MDELARRLGCFVLGEVFDPAPEEGLFSCGVGKLCPCEEGLNGRHVLLGRVCVRDAVGVDLAQLSV